MTPARATNKIAANIVAGIPNSGTPICVDVVDVAVMGDVAVVVVVVLVDAVGAMDVVGEVVADVVGEVVADVVGEVVADVVGEVVLLSVTSVQYTGSTNVAVVPVMAVVKVEAGSVSVMVYVVLCVEYVVVEVVADAWEYV